MKEILKSYQERGQEVQIHVRDKVIEGKVESVDDALAHIVGDRFEYHVPYDRIQFIAAKLEGQKQKRKAVGF